MRKIFRKIHTYLAIPLGIIIFILCITGCVLVFQKEIQQLINPSFYRVSDESLKMKNVLPLSELIPKVNEQLDNNLVKDVTLYSDSTIPYKVGLSEGFRASAYVDPYTAKLLGQEDTRFFQITMSLHRWFLDSSKTWGKQITGWSTVGFIVILITGFFYINKRLKTNYRVEFKKGKKRLWFDLHNTLGNYSFIMLLILCLSGLMWSFPVYRDAVYYIFGDQTVVEKKANVVEDNKNKGQKGQGKKQETINYEMWDQVLVNFTPYASNYDNVKIANGVITAHPKNTYRPRVTDEYAFNPKNAEIGEITLFESQPLKKRIHLWAYSLHVGDYWGIWSKIITAIASLIGGLLPLTGYYLWYRKRRKRTVKK